MSSTLLRAGLWILIISLALYVIHESYEDSPVAEFVPIDVIQKGIALGGLLILGGLIIKLLEKGARVVVKNRCTVCNAVIPDGAIYCRPHLREILAVEDEKTHMTKVKRDTTLIKRDTTVTERKVKPDAKMGDSKDKRDATMSTPKARPKS